MNRPDGRRSALRARLRPVLSRIRRHVPRGLRIVVGLLLILGGIFGFLPVLGSG